MTLHMDTYFLLFLLLVLLASLSGGVEGSGEFLLLPGLA